MVTELCREIAKGVGESFTCQEVGDYVQVRTPFVYPDGRVIDLYLRPVEDWWTASDLGETNRWLDAHSWAETRTEAQKGLIRQICETLGIEEFRGALIARVDDRSHTSDVLTRLAQAASRVSDIWLTFRAKVVQTVRDDVEEFLGEKHIDYQREVRRQGKSGISWRLDFETRSAGQISLVQVLTTGSRGAASQVRDHTVSAWVDLGAAQSNGRELISLFDDTKNVWKDEDFRQLEAVSTVALWSSPEDFAAYLGLSSRA